MTGRTDRSDAAFELARWGRVDPVLDLPIPRYDGRSLANVAATVVRAATGHDPPTASAGPLEPAIDPFAGRRADGPIVVALVDGLGWDAYRRWTTGSGASDRPWIANAHAISSVFPTTTTAALTSLSTGTAPSQHGLVAYRQYLPRFGAVVDLLRMSPVGVPGCDLFVQPEWTPEMVAGAPPIFGALPRSAIVSRDRFDGSGFTRILYGSAPYVGYATGADLAHRLGELLARRHPPDVVYVYWDELDTVQHLRGPELVSVVDLELSHIASLLAHVARRIGPRAARRTRLVLTADHGQVPADVRQQIRVDRLPAVIREMRHPLAGDRRAGFFAARPGREHALAAALRRSLPRGSRLVEMSIAVERGLFGPPPFHPELSDRTGDLLALVPPPSGLVSLLPGTPEPTRHLVGAHGGLHPAELVVPLASGTFDELLEEPSPRTPPEQR